MKRLISMVILLIILIIPIISQASVSQSVYDRMWLLYKKRYAGSGTDFAEIIKEEKEKIDKYLHENRGTSIDSDPDGVLEYALNYRDKDPLIASWNQVIQEGLISDNSDLYNFLNDLQATAENSANVLPEPNKEEPKKQSQSTPQTQSQSQSQSTPQSQIGGLNELNGENPANFNPSSYQNTSSTKTYVEKVSKVLTILRSIGIVLSVIALMIIGIREMFASVEEKSEIKKAMPGYIIGIIMVTAITVLPSIIFEAVNNIK